MPFAADQIADKNGVELVRLSKLYDFPDFVKQADFDQLINPGSLATSVYADPVRKQYPCHNKEAAWLSAAYFLEKKAEFHPKDAKRIEERLEHYVDYWRIRPHYEQLKTAHAALHKDAEDKMPDSLFAYVWVDDRTGRKDRHLPLRNAMETKVAAEWLQTYCDRFTFGQRHAIAIKIKEAQAKYGAGLGKAAEFINQQAGHGVCDPQEVVEMIQKRAYLTQHPEQKERLEKLALTVRTSKRQALQPQMLIKLAETMDIIDRGLGLTGKYGTELVRPESVIFKTTFDKVAEELQQVVATQSGKVYEKEALRKLAIADVQALFGSEFADRVRVGLHIDPEKMAEEIHTLPRPDAELLDALLGDSGIAPVLTKAASTRRGLSKLEMEAWEQAYQTVS